MTTQRLLGKVALITGSDSGIGQATGAAFALSLIHISEPTRPY